MRPLRTASTSPSLSQQYKSPLSRVPPAKPAERPVLPEASTACAGAALITPEDTLPRVLVEASGGSAREEDDEMKEANSSFDYYGDPIDEAILDACRIHD